MSLFDDLFTIANNLTKEAEATGDVQTFRWGDDSVKPITKNGKVVGSYRMMGLEVTITPKKEPARKRKTKRIKRR